MRPGTLRRDLVTDALQIASPRSVSLCFFCDRLCPPIALEPMTEDAAMSAQAPRLRVLLQLKHWQNHRTFSREYDKAARSVDPLLRGTAPSRAQLYRWLSGELKGLPYGDHCRILEKMFPEWSAAQLFEMIPVAETASFMMTRSSAPEHQPETSAEGQLCLVTSGGDLSAALLAVVRNSQDCLVAVGSRSQAPTYLQEIELAIQRKPDLVHYRILVGPPHSQVLKDHLLRLIELRNARAARNGAKTLHISILSDLAQYPERFFVANERTAVITLPSANSPMNFDTGLVAQDPIYAKSLLQHGQALYGKHRLESLDAINKLEVLG